VVITKAKQLEKEINKGKTIYTKMVEKEVDKPSQVGEF
jgi:urease beta subunit